MLPGAHPCYRARSSFCTIASLSEVFSITFPILLKCNKDDNHFFKPLSHVPIQRPRFEGRCDHNTRVGFPQTEG